jgi:nicotinate-nucleotide pyrophosphorylase
MEMEILVSDGSWCRAIGFGVGGSDSAILTGERTALEFLGRPSGIATETRRFVDTRGYFCKDLLRATYNAGLRLLERYAMAAGGAFCREGKSILLTENHVAVAGGVKAALDQAHSFVSSQMKLQAMTAYEAVRTQLGETEANALPIQIEVRNEGGVGKRFRLKHMAVADARRCVEIVHEARPDLYY